MSGKDFVIARTDAQGLKGAEKYYVPTDYNIHHTMVLKDGNDWAIDLVDILVDGAKQKDFASLTKDDINPDFLPQTDDEENVENLLNFIKRNKVLTPPRLRVEGIEREITKATLTAPLCYVRISGSNDVINVRELLKSESKNKSLSNIKAEDINPDIQIDSNVALSDDDNIKLLAKVISHPDTNQNDTKGVYIKYKGKIVCLDKAIYGQEGVATETTLETGKDDTSSVNKRYYIAHRTDNSSPDTKYVESSKIMPPVYGRKYDLIQKLEETAEKLADDESKVNKESEWVRLLYGQDVEFKDSVASYTREVEDGSTERVYRKNPKVKFHDEALYLVEGEGDNRKEIRCKDNKLDMYSACEMFKKVYQKDDEGEYIKDKHGNLIPLNKKDKDGNDILDEAGEPIPEEELNSGLLIQTAKEDENGEIKVFDIDENNEKVKEFKKKVEELKTKLKELQEKLETLKSKLKELEDKLAKGVKLSKEEHEEIAKLQKGIQNRQGEIAGLQNELEGKLDEMKELQKNTSAPALNKLIEDFQNGEFFDTFLFDEDGNLYYIDNGKTVSLSGMVECDFGGDLIGNYAVKNNKGKCQVVLNSKSENVIANCLKVTEVLYTASFAPSIFSLVVLPFALTVGTATAAVAGGVAITSVVRNKIKQHQLNHLTPEKIKEQMCDKLEKQTKKDIKEATRAYNQSVRRVEKNYEEGEEKDKLLAEAQAKFEKSRSAIIARFNVLDEMTIESPFTLKDKTITNKNLLGQAEWRRQLDIIKNKGLPPDAETEYKLSQAKEEEKDDILNEWKSQHGPTQGLHDRIYYLKQTKKYRASNDKDRKELKSDCRKQMENDEKLKGVDKASVPASTKPDDTKEKLLNWVKEHSPEDPFKKDDIPLRPEDYINTKRGDAESNITKVKDRETLIGKTTEAEKDYNQGVINIDSVTNEKEQLDNEVVGQQNKRQDMINAVSERQKLIDELKTKLKEKQMPVWIFDDEEFLNCGKNKYAHDKKIQLGNNKIVNDKIFLKYVLDNFTKEVNNLILNYGRLKLKKTYEEAYQDILDYLDKNEYRKKFIKSKFLTSIAKSPDKIEELVNELKASGYTPREKDDARSV